MTRPRLLDLFCGAGGAAVGYAQVEMVGRYSVILCGSSFGLGVRRHRLFASNVMLMGLPCAHDRQGQPVGVYGHGGGIGRSRGHKATLPEAIDAMGIDWMTRAEISQAIPPAYTEHIGAQLMETRNS